MNKTVNRTFKELTDNRLFLKNYCNRLLYLIITLSTLFVHNFYKVSHVFLFFCFESLANVTATL